MALAIVQHSGAIHGNSVPGSASSVVLTSAPTAGNLLIAVIGVNLATSSVTVNTGSWTPFEFTKNAGDGSTMVMMALYRYVQIGDSATLPAFWTAGGTYWSHTVWEVSGVTGTFASDLLFSFPVDAVSANNAFPPFPVPAKCLAFAATASYNGGTNPSYSGTWTTDETHNNNANFGSSSGAHRAMNSGDLIDGTPTQGTSAPYGAMYFALADGSLPTTPYVRHVISRSANGHPRTVETYHAPVVGNLLIGYLSYDRGANANPILGAGWTTFAAQNGSVNEMIVAFYRYVQGGDTSLLPEITTVGSGGSFYNLNVVELAGGFTGSFLADHVSDKTGVQTTGLTPIVTTSDSTTGTDQLALVAFSNYNASAFATLAGTGWNYAGCNEHDAAVYGAWFVGFQRYPASGATVQSTLTPANSDYSAYIQTIFSPGAASGGNSNVQVVVCS